MRWILYRINSIVKLKFIQGVNQKLIYTINWIFYPPCSVILKGFPIDKPYVIKLIIKPTSRVTKILNYPKICDSDTVYKGCSFKSCTESVFTSRKNTGQCL